MKANIVMYNSEKSKPQFTLTGGIRPWGILLAISKGSYRLSFPDLCQEMTVSPYEISYIPPHTNFHREVIEPVDFHQFAFQLLQEDPELTLLPAGKLEIPVGQVEAILKSADRIAGFPEDADLLPEHILQRILIDHRLFSHAHTAPKVSRELAAALDYISNHLHQPLSVAKLAASLHLSHNGFIWKCKQELGVTPLKYIAMCRIKRAKQLLFERELTITQIAERCGYANAYYFSNAFKKNEGMSPSEFRRTCLP